MNTDEIKTVIILSGNTRLPHLEDEIFADKGLTTLYLHTLCKELEWYESGGSNACLSYFYAKHILGQRWSKSEHVIAADPTFGYGYARYVLKDRWPEAEAAIKLDEDYWEWYRNHFGIEQ